MDPSPHLSPTPHHSGSVERGQATAEGGRSLLDLRTQLVKPDRRLVQTSGWKFNNWPGCAEASVSIVTSGSSRPSSGRSRVKSDDEAAELWQIANGRAGSRSRRYFVLNRLRYMWVLTFADARRDRRLVMSEVADFAVAFGHSTTARTSPTGTRPNCTPEVTAGTSTSLSRFVLSMR
jgi:hypothetical protein